MQGDKAILPLSINTDSSVNFINNIGAIPQLSYSNLEWKSNLNLIKGKNRNIMSRYSASKEDIENISKEFLLRIERI